MAEQATADLKTAALAELEGLNSITEETVQTNSVETANDTIETEEEDEEASESETTAETEKAPEKSEEQIRKEVEKEMKRKYYSKINQNQKLLEEAKAEVERLKSAGYDTEQIDAIKAIVRAETQEKELSKIEQSELKNFQKKYAPDSETLWAIKEIVNDFPSMSYEAARMLYLAQNNPQALIRQQSPNLSAPGNTPKAIAEWPDINDPSELRRQAELIANQFAGRA